MKYTSPWCMHMALIIQFLLASMLVLPGAESSEHYLRTELIHVDANGGFTREQLIRRAAERAHLRAAMLSPADTQDDKKMKVEAETSSHFEYLMHLEVDMDGKGRKRFLAVADTGSEMVWMRMKKEMQSHSTTEPVPCSCTTAVDAKQAGATAGATTAPAPAVEVMELLAFTKTYGFGAKAAKGIYCPERKLSFLLPSKTVAEEETNKGPDYDIDMGFAIHYDHDLMPESADGIVGLSGSPSSLVYQLADRYGFQRKFSYCLINPLIADRQASPFWFGRDPVYSDLTSTQLVQVSPHTDLYHVELLGISIDKDKRKDLPNTYFKHRSQQDHGVMFIDTGCSHTFLEKPVFKELIDQLVGKLGKSNETITIKGKVHSCFPPDTDHKMEPTLVLHLNNDAQMRIPWSNYIQELEDEERPKPKVHFCLAINESTGVSILGNILQHNIYMHYDLTSDPKPGKLSFKQVDNCRQVP